MTKQLDNQDWEEEYLEYFGRFPSSAHWFESVKTFIKLTRNRDKQRLLREVDNFFEINLYSKTNPQIKDLINKVYDQETN